MPITAVSTQLQRRKRGRESVSDPDARNKTREDDTYPNMAAMPFACQPLFCWNGPSGRPDRSVVELCPAALPVVATPRSAHCSYMKLGRGSNAARSTMSAGAEMSVMARPTSRCHSMWPASKIVNLRALNIGGEEHAGTYNGRTRRRGCRRRSVASHFRLLGPAQYRGARGSPGPRRSAGSASCCRSCSPAHASRSGTCARASG